MLPSNARERLHEGIIFDSARPSTDLWQAITGLIAAGDELAKQVPGPGPVQAWHDARELVLATVAPLQPGEIEYLAADLADRVMEVVYPVVKEELAAIFGGTA